MSHKSLSHLIIAFIFLINNLSADSIKLKNGTVLEGKIVEETTDSITIEYKVTKIDLSQVSAGIIVSLVFSSLFFSIS